jgi:hypothetical protein
MLNLLSETTQYNPTAIFAELSAAYTSIADDAALGTFSVRNPWNQLAVNNDNLLLDGWLSTNYVDLMDGTTLTYSDPRLPLTASLTQFGDYRGTKNGAGRVGSGTADEESYISLTGFYSSTNSKLFIITYEEMKFIEAEAALRSNDRPRAYTAYLEAITANMNKMGVPAAQRDAYLANPLVAVGAAALTLGDIFREKYKALFLMPVSWDDARRHDYAYPGFTLPDNVTQPPAFVRRLMYPAVEISRNGANVPDINSNRDRLWWDQ